MCLDNAEMWDGLHLGSPGQSLFPKAQFQAGLCPKGCQMMAVPDFSVVFTSVEVGGGALLVFAMPTHLVQECWRPENQTSTFWSPTEGLGSSSRQNATTEHER